VFGKGVHWCIPVESVVEESNRSHLLYVQSRAFPSPIIFSELITLDIKLILLDADYCTINFRSNCHISRIIIGCGGILSCIDCIVGGKVIVWVRVLIYLVTVS
jgi:hypothetical protein